jgi:hypothetical protein
MIKGIETSGVWYNSILKKFNHGIDNIPSKKEFELPETSDMQKEKAVKEPQEEVVLSTDNPSPEAEMMKSTEEYLQLKNQHRKKIIDKFNNEKDGDS